ncbi:hypothetical protein K439DRAFT_1407858 [Ramaria rubella]|nr:hypothetical protein K439DRAFT_1407858 [Ramaria rubella]
MDVDSDEAQVVMELTPAPDKQLHLALAAEFNPFPFTHDARNIILARRAAMSNELIFDLLLEQASIASPQSLFPPESPEALLYLLEAISNCHWDSLKKSCLYFYLLSHVSSDVAARYATTCAVPPQFIHLAHACFFLDCDSPEGPARAVALLSDARIVQDLSSKIIHTLSLAPQPMSSRLIRTYVRTAQPVLEAFEDLSIYLLALLEYSLADAWTFQRTFSETTPLRNRLFRTLLDGCLIPPKPSVLPHLLSLPLTAYEFSLLQSYALSPPEDLTPAAHSILQDLITVRLLHSGKYSDAIRLSRAFDALNAKARTGNRASLHKAAEERQQMMRDVLAVVPEVQRRELELEFNDEQVDGEGTALGGSWANVDDISMSWDNLEASTSGKGKEKSRADRLEGSPAPKLPGRASTPNAPFGLFSSPAASSQRRKSGARMSTNIFDKATPVKSALPLLPTIPTAGPALGSPSIVSGFRPPQQFGFTATPPRPALNGISPTSGTGLNARNAFYNSESSRPGSSLFGGPLQKGETSGMSAMPKKSIVNGARKASGSQHVVADQTMEDERDQPPSDDVMMVESDDPDSFVVHGRRRTSFRPPPPIDNTDEDLDKADVVKKPLNGAPMSSTALFGRHEEAARSADHMRRTSSPKAKILPGGYTSFEFADSAPSRPAAAALPVTHDQPRPETASRTSHTRSSRFHEPELEPQRLKIPGALFEEEAEVEAGEEEDNVPSLPSVSAKGSRRTRARRASSATESGDDEEATKTPLRRSSRLFSTGLSPEVSPQKPEKKTTSKRNTRVPASEGAGRSTRKRKNTAE